MVKYIILRKLCRDISLAVCGNAGNLAFLVIKQFCNCFCKYKISGNNVYYLLYRKYNVFNRQLHYDVTTNLSGRNLKKKEQKKSKTIGYENIHVVNAKPFSHCG